MSKSDITNTIIGSNVITNQQLQALVQNLNTRAPKTSITVLGKAYIAKNLASLAESVLEARAVVTTAKAGWINARVKCAEVEDGVVPIMAALRVMLVPMLGNDVAALADLAVTPRKKARALTSEERLTAATKANATRTVRGTLGKAKKARLKGNVTGVVVTPVTSQAPSASTSPVAAPSTLQASQPAASVVASPDVAPAVAPTATASIAAAALAPVTPGH